MRHEASHRFSSFIYSMANLKTNNKGDLKGFFLIPDHRGKQNSSVPKFETGDIEFRITSNTRNDKSRTTCKRRSNTS